MVQGTLGQGPVAQPFGNPKSGRSGASIEAAPLSKTERKRKNKTFRTVINSVQEAAAASIRQKLKYLKNFSKVGVKNGANLAIR